MPGLQKSYTRDGAVDAAAPLWYTGGKADKVINGAADRAGPLLVDGGAAWLTGGASIPASVAASVATPAKSKAAKSGALQDLKIQRSEKIDGTPLQDMPKVISETSRRPASRLSSLASSTGSRRSDISESADGFEDFAARKMWTMKR